MSRLRPRREQFQPKEICLGKYIGCWDSRKKRCSRAHVLGCNWASRRSITLREVYTDFASSPKQRKKYFLFFSPPLYFQGFLWLDFWQGNCKDTGQTSCSQKTVSRLSQQRERSPELAGDEDLFPSQHPRESPDRGDLTYQDCSEKPPATLNLIVCNAACP